MKNFILLVVTIVICSCSNSINEEKEKAEIISLLEKESQYAANADVTNWSACWVNTDEASFIMTDANGNYDYTGYQTLEDEIGQIAPFELKLSRENYPFCVRDRYGIC